MITGIILGKPKAEKYSNPKDPNMDGGRKHYVNKEIAADLINRKGMQNSDLKFSLLMGNVVSAAKRREQRSMPHISCLPQKMATKYRRTASP